MAGAGLENLESNEVMPCIIQQLTPNGLKPVDYSADSLASAALYEPTDGVYTITNTYDTLKVLKFDAHLDRLEDSARRAGIPLNLDRQRLRDTLRMLIRDAGYGDVRFRLTIPRDRSDHIIISIEPFKAPAPEIIANGVRCITAANSARPHPEAKTTDWMHARKALEAAMPAGIYDTFLLDAEGFIMEGLASNFYAILNDQLRTAGEGVLKGISQQIVFEVARDIIPLVLRPVHRDEIPQFSEAFLTSSSRGIIPVVEIDGHPIGTGVPGPKTKALLVAYRSWVNEHLEIL